jgi:O-antigen ligase
MSPHAARPRFGAGHPLALAIAVAPVAVVLQNRVLAPIALLGLMGSVLLAWRAGWRPEGLPRLASVLLTLLGWGAVSAIWAPDAGRALDAALRLAGMTTLAGLAGAAAMAAPMPRLGRWAALGLGIGLAAALFDSQTGHALRAGVRGLAEAPVQLGFGLKNAVSVLALLAPLAIGQAALPTWARLGLAAATLAVATLLPGESARLAAIAGVVATALALALPRWTGPALGIGAALLLLLAPALVHLGFAGGVEAAGLPFSAAHRLLIWDFVAARIWDSPWIGWGMDAARAIPGGGLPPDAAMLGRFGLSARASDFAVVQLLPLHPHNAALQVWLELGAVGAVLAAWLLVQLGLAARSAPAAGCLAAALVTAMLSYGVWQYWWVAGLLLVAAFIPLLSSAKRRA